MNQLKISTDELAFIREAITEKYESIMNQLVLPDDSTQMSDDLRNYIRERTEILKKPHWTHTAAGKRKLAARKRKG